MRKNVYTREELKDSLVHETNREIGICEKLRMVYDLVYTLPDSELKENLTNELIDALGMAKRIADRLTYYFETYNDSSGNRGASLVQIDKQHLHWLYRNRKKRKI